MPETVADRTRPQITYPEALPITAQRPVLLDALREHRAVVVAGETGSGKSTQLPKLCLELGRGTDRLIGHTQPRRLAARTIAARVAEELGTSVGERVGYKVRFTDEVGPDTQVKLMTDGVLLAELRRDPRLERYDTIIIDEAHERSLNIDFLLGYLTNLLERRDDLKVVITSATIDTERFARHFDAPVVEVSGRTFPVEVRYRPLDPQPSGKAGTGSDNGRSTATSSRGGQARPPAQNGPRGQRAEGGRAASGQLDQVDGILGAVDELRAEGPGDILVFLSGQREIRDAATALTDANLPDIDILPLYARLSAAEQQRVFRPHKGRRIVLATNVAETSITVPGIHYVIDPGMARISRYNRRTKVQRLPIEPISQASADQRAGRCGRVAAGVCIRLYDEEDLAARPEFTEPEILRTNLASVILQMAGLGLGEVESFPFVDPPDARAIRDAVNLLVELGAMRPDRSLTKVGRRLARLPVDPRFGRMLLEAETNDCLREATIIAAALSIQDPRERPTGEEQRADELHARFRAPGSDFLAYLNLWEYVTEAQRSRSGNQFRRMCRAEHLHHVRIREWQDLVRQLRDITHELGLRRNRDKAGADAVHRSLLAGLLSQVGMWDDNARTYRAARQATFSIGFSSALAKGSPAWVMAGELVETGRLWARTVARIDPSWIEPLAGHLVKRTYGEPAWDRRRGTAIVDERVLLNGLPIVPGRPVPLGRVDPDEARAMFIDHALVGGDWEHDDSPLYAFLGANRRLVDDMHDLAARSRRNDLIVSDDYLAQLYDRRVGAEVTSSRHFERWWRRTRGDEPDRLNFRHEDLISSGLPSVDAADVPATWTVDGQAYELSYVFSPGAADDGVTVHVPLAVLPRLSADAFAWNVPGYRLELVTALIRALPKALRRQLAPAPERARDVLDQLTDADRGAAPLPVVLARRLSRLAGEAVSSEDLDLAQLPEHLRPRFSIDDDRGNMVAASRDLSGLQSELAVDARRAVARASSLAERQGLRNWQFGDLPATVEVEHAGHRVLAYPAVVDEGTSVGLRVLTGPADQAKLMWGGSRRLLQLAVPEAVAQVERRLKDEPTLAVARPGLPDMTELAADCATAAADRILAARGGPAWDEAAQRELEGAARDRLARLAVGAAGPAAELVAAAVGLGGRLEATTASALQPAVDDMRHNLAGLVFPGFVTAAGLTRLRDVARYLEATRLRLNKLAERIDRDRAHMERVRAVEGAYEDAVAALPASRHSDDDVLEVGWMLEELRVSVFAQHLGTARPVSEQRIHRLLTDLRP